MVQVVCADVPLFTAGIPSLGIHFGDRPGRLHLCRRLALRAKVLKPGRVTMGPGPRRGGIAVVSWTRLVSAAVPGADVRAPLPQAANYEVLSVREIGRDESELHLGGRPEAAADVSIWRVISQTFGVLRERRV